MRLSKIKKFCCVMMSLVLVAGLFGINSGVSDVKASESTNEQTKVYAGSELTITGSNVTVEGTNVTNKTHYPTLDIILPDGGVYATSVTVTMENNSNDKAQFYKKSSYVGYENDATQFFGKDTDWTTISIDAQMQGNVSIDIATENQEQKLTKIHFVTPDMTNQSLNLEIVSVTVTLSSVVREVVYQGSELTYTNLNMASVNNATVTNNGQWPAFNIQLPGDQYAKRIQVKIKNNITSQVALDSRNSYLKDVNDQKVGTANGTWTIPSEKTVSLGWDIDVDSLGTKAKTLHFQMASAVSNLNLTIISVTVTLSSVVHGQSYLGSELRYESKNQCNITEAPKITYSGAWAKFCIYLPKAVYASSVTVTMKSSNKTVSILSDSNSKWLYSDGTNSNLGGGGNVTTNETSIRYTVPEEYKNKKISGIQIGMNNVTSGESLEIISVVVNDMLNDDVTMLMDNLKDTTNCYDAISAYESSSNLTKIVIDSRINPYGAIAIPTLTSGTKTADSEYLNGRLSLNASVAAPLDVISQVGILVTPTSKLGENSLTLNTVDTVEAGTMSQTSPSTEGTWESVLLGDNDYASTELTAVSYVQYNDGALTVYSTGEITSGETSVVAGTNSALTTNGVAAPTQTTWQVGNVVTDNTEIDVVDLVRLLKYVDESYEEEVTIHYAQSDVNVDGVIDKSDISKLREGLCGSYEWPTLPYADAGSIKKDWTLE